MNSHCLFNLNYNEVPTLQSPAMKCSENGWLAHLLNGPVGALVSIPAWHAEHGP